MSLIRRWADSIEEQLWSYKSLASHSGLTGQSREELLMASLAAFLPNELVLGRGQVVDSNGDSSREMDIVVARGDCVKLPQSSGVTIFLLESVLAVCEVKSRLSRAGLIDGFKKAQSVYSLGFVAELPDPRTPDRIERVDRITDDEALLLSLLVPYPEFYLYAFSSALPKNLIRIGEALRVAAVETSIPPQHVPSVIAAQGVVVIRNDGILIPKDAFDGPWLFAWRAEQHPLYWILAHLLRSLISRIGSGLLSEVRGRYIMEAHLEEIPADGWKLFVPQGLW